MLCYTIFSNAECHASPRLQFKNGGCSQMLASFKYTWQKTSCSEWCPLPGIAFIHWVINIEVWSPTRFSQLETTLKAHSVSETLTSTGESFACQFCNPASDKSPDPPQFHEHSLVNCLPISFHLAGCFPGSQPTTYPFVHSFTKSLSMQNSKKCILKRPSLSM
jgi:hypothetical protein